MMLSKKSYQESSAQGGRGPTCDRRDDAYLPEGKGESLRRRENKTSRFGGEVRTLGERVLTFSGWC